MAKAVQKKRLVISQDKLAPELLERLLEHYPTGYTDAMMRIDKPNGDFFYAVPFETEDIYYLVKINVKIDGKINDDRDIFETDDDEVKDATEHLSERAVEDLELSDED